MNRIIGSTSGCSHLSLAPVFDKEAARNMSAAEIRTRFPRAFGTCPDCGWYGVQYASYEHYIAGDW